MAIGLEHIDIKGALHRGAQEVLKETNVSVTWIHNYDVSTDTHLLTMGDKTTGKIVRRRITSEELRQARHFGEVDSMVKKIIRAINNELNTNAALTDREYLELIRLREPTQEEPTRSPQGAQVHTLMNGSTVRVVPSPLAGIDSDIEWARTRLKRVGVRLESNRSNHGRRHPMAGVYDSHIALDEPPDLPPGVPLPGSRQPPPSPSNVMIHMAEKSEVYIPLKTDQTGAGSIPINKAEWSSTDSNPLMDVLKLADGMRAEAQRRQTGRF